MKIIVASTVVPLIEGGGTFIVDWLVEKLNAYGHQATALKIPFSSHYRQMISQMLALRLYHIEDACDRLVCVRTPSYLLKHPDKRLWFIHHYREVYDLWDTELSGMPRDAEALAIREYIMRADETAFSESKQIYANSQIVSRRLMEFNGVESMPLYPPLLHPEQFYTDGYGDTIYYPSRVNTTKRQLLAVEAMRFVKTDVKLLLTGRSEQPGYADRIHQCIHQYRLEKKVTFRDEWISEKEKADLFSKCLCALYIPIDEDSYGYPSLEAHQSRKAVITCTDSGGTSELIMDDDNGYIVEPNARTLAASFDRMFEEKHNAERMGQRGLERIEELGINWDHVVEAFTL